MKRKKYSEELEARLSDDDVKVIVKAKKSAPAASKEPAVQLFVVSNSHRSTASAEQRTHRPHTTFFIDLQQTTDITVSEQERIYRLDITLSGL